MADYRPLLPKQVTASKDTSGGINNGNFTAAIDTSQISNLTVFECYKIALDGPIGFGCSIYVGINKWDHVAQGWKNGASGAMLLRAGDQLFFYFEAPSTATPVPTVTAWFRFDASLPENTS